MGEAVAGPVPFRVPAEVAFDYLTDPVNRPAWQSSLRRVEVLDPGPAHEGQRWVDVTKPGPRPQMRTTTLSRPGRWVEAGSWRGITLEGELLFTPSPEGCDVTATARFRGTGPWRGVVPLLARTAAAAVAADLRRAATLLMVPGIDK
jgi:hypothetical protein